LTDLSQAELQALATSQLATNKQSRLQTLLSQQKENKLTDIEAQELDSLLFHIDQLTILKTRANYTLPQSNN
jgi:hypothetical protein